MRDFYKTVFRIEVLSEEEPIGEDVDLATINYLITDGHCSGIVTRDSPEKMSAPEMARLLLAQGSDPEFFRLDEQGNELED